MKARLVTYPKDPGVPVHALAPNTPIPDGWEELELVTEPQFRGTTLVEPASAPDPDPNLCTCGHPRQDHAVHIYGCLSRRDTAGDRCDCVRFEEVG